MRLEKSLKGKSGAGNPLRKCTEFKRLVSFCTAAIAIPVLAETYVWTGAVGNGKYADPGNWTVGGAVATTVPGRYKDSGGTEVGSFEDSVLFGPLTGVAEATIDFENAVSVSNFVIQSGAPAYTFGTSNQQTFKIINGVASSSQRAYMTVESGVETEQTFALGIVFGAQNYYTDIRNDGSKELVFLAGLGKPYNPYVTFLGTGDIRFKNYTARDYRGYNNSEGVLIFDTCTSSGTFKFLQSNGSQPGRILINGENDVLIISDGVGTEFKSGSAGCRVYGNGMLKVAVRYNQGTSEYVNLSAPQGKTMTVDTRVSFLHENTSYSGTDPKCVQVRGAGIVALNNLCTGVHKEMRIGGGGSNAANKSTTLALNYVGAACDPLSHVGQTVTNLTFEGDGTLSYTGTGETATLPLAGIGGAAQTVTLQNKGSGQLQYAGDVGSLHQGLRLRLDAVTSGIRFAGVYVGEGQLIAVIAGTAGVSMATPSVCDAYEFEGGFLRFTTAGTYSMSASLASGSSKLAIPDGASLSIQGFSAESGATLDIEMDVDRSHVFLPGYSGDVSSLRINGYGGLELTAGGELILNVSRWAVAADGRWADGTKWIGGVPAAGKNTWVKADGANDYTVTVDEEPATISHLEIGGGSISPKATVDFRVPVELATADAVKVLKGGEVKISQGGQLVLGDANALNLNGGSLDVQMDASLKWNGSIIFGSGETVFHGDAAMTNLSQSSFLIGADKADEMARVSISGLYNDINQSYITVGKPVCDGTRAILDFNNDSDCLSTQGSTANYTNVYFAGNNPYYMAVGFRRGCGEINVSGGSVNIGNVGVYVGTEVDNASVTNPSDDVNCATGVVNVTRGALFVSGTGATYEKRQICGFVIGDGVAVKTELRDQTHYWGELNLSGNGLVGTHRGAMVVGAGSADGFVRQSGGRLYMSASPAPVVVGFEGGTGTYDITGGRIDCADVYVGGATIDQLKQCNGQGVNVLDENKLQPDRHDAQGTLKLAGGVANVTGGIHVGVDGSGTVEVSGTNATSCATLDLTGAGATMAFKFGEDGKTHWSFCPAAINIGTGAKLVVDLSECEKVPFGMRRLAECSSVTGAFATEDVSIVMPPSENHEAEIVYGRNGQPGLWLHVRHGFVLIFR